MNQFKALIPCSTIYFLGMSLQLSQKPATKNSSVDKKRQSLQFLRLEFENKNIVVQRK